jgi:hypothetical protein
MENLDPEISIWLENRSFAPVNVVRPVAWMSHGDFLVSNGHEWRYLRHCLDNPAKRYMPLKYVAVGVKGTYVVVWADDTRNVQLGNRYPALEQVLKETREADVGVRIQAFALLLPG